MVLNEELKDNYITKQEQEDYITLFLIAAGHVLRDHEELREEVHNMIETKTKLPSVMISELKEEIAEKDSQIADKDAKIQHLQELIDQMTSGKHVL